jgi:hypothetical protein
MGIQEGGLPSYERSLSKTGRGLRSVVMVPGSRAVSGTGHLTSCANRDR